MTNVFDARPARWIVASLILGLTALLAISAISGIVGRSGIAGPLAPRAIEGLVLEQNYPNPFSTVTEIQYVLPSSGHVLMRVFNTLGQEVGRPVDDDKPSGRQAVKFDGSVLPSGQYAYTLVFTADADKSTGKLTRKMYLLR